MCGGEYTYLFIFIYFLKLTSLFLQRVPDDDDDDNVAPEQPLYRTPSTTLLRSEHNLPDNDFEDLIPYSEDSPQRPAAMKTLKALTPGPIPSDEPNSSQDPLDVISRSKTPVTPLKTTFPYEIPADKLRSHSQNEDTEFFTGSALGVPDTLQPASLLKLHSPDPLRFSSLSPLSQLFPNGRAEEFAGTSNPAHSSSRRPSGT